MKRIFFLIAHKMVGENMETNKTIKTNYDLEFGELSYSRAKCVNLTLESFEVLMSKFKFTIYHKKIFTKNL